MATVLGVGDNAGSDNLTVTLTANQPPGTVVHVIHAAVLHGLAFFDNPFVSAISSDSRSGTWHDSAFVGVHDPIIGASLEHNGGAPLGSRAGIQVGQTSVRVAGADLQSGDTVTVHWNDNGEGASQMTIVALVIAFSEFNGTAVTQYLGGTAPGDFVNVYFANGCGGQEQAAFDGKTVTWSGAPGFDLPYPSVACKMFAASATYPAATGYTPVNGAKVTEHQSADGNLALAVHVASAAALSAIEPGGAWSTAAQAITMNYQFAEENSIGLRSWQRF